MVSGDKDLSKQQKGLGFIDGMGDLHCMDLLHIIAGGVPPQSSAFPGINGHCLIMVHM